MNVWLMYRDRDLDPEEKLPPNQEALAQDLELATLWRAMAAKDPFLYEMARQVLLTSLRDPEAIRYRQEILRDCLDNPAVIREMYQITLEALANKKNSWLGLYGTNYPTSTLGSAVRLLEMLVELLKRLRKLADEHAGRFASEGFRRFWGMIQQELEDDYFAVVDAHLKALQFRRGVLLSAQLGKGNEVGRYVLRRPPEREGWVKQVLSQRPPVYGFQLDPRDDHGARALSDIKDRGINLVANAAAQSAEHIDSFFNALRLELAFYVGCLNLHEQLAALGEPVAFPAPLATHTRSHAYAGLYDVALALTLGQRVVGNDANADGKEIVIITGANQGGKSTLLRSIGQAQLMMQCGMFVAAESFRANCCTGLFTHYRREEDATMKSGKLDEELVRMSAIVEQLTPDALVLFNESFAATNEREGSEIAGQIVRALLEKRIKVFFVTHLYAFARSLYERRRQEAFFLRAEREADGGRTFRVSEGEPLETAYGEDLYQEVFQTEGMARD